MRIRFFAFVFLGKDFVHTFLRVEYTCPGPDICQNLHLEALLVGSLAGPFFVPVARSSPVGSLAGPFFVPVARASPVGSLAGPFFVPVARSSPVGSLAGPRTPPSPGPVPGLPSTRSFRCLSRGLASGPLPAAVLG